MNKIKAILIDDEQHCLDVLEWELNGADKSVEIIASFTNPLEAVKGINELNPDLVFLDIEMPNMNGLQLLQSFDVVSFNVIFTTAFEHYALQAIKNQAIDYLLKPINPRDLKLALTKHRNSDVNRLQFQLNTLFKKLQEQNDSQKKIVMPTADGLEFLKLEDIIRCESSSNYTFIHLRKRNKLLVSKTLKEVESMIDSPMFSRVHKSHLVNLNSIVRYNKSDGGVVLMEDGSEVPLARNKKSDFLNNL